MRRYLKMIKPFDVIIVVALMALSFLPVVLFARAEAAHQAATPARSARVLTAVVTHDGEEVYRIKLTGHKGTTRFRYNDGGDYNEIVTTGNAIQITEADCSDQVCVRRGKISKSGETIVCLPHKLLIEIHSSKGDQTGGMVTE